MLLVSTHPGSTGMKEASQKTGVAFGRVKDVTRTLSLLMVGLYKILVKLERRGQTIVS